jgi:hypothetical protein
VVGPAPAMPLPSIEELIEAATPPMYRNPGQLRFRDTGHSPEVVPNRSSAAD